MSIAIRNAFVALTAVLAIAGTSVDAYAQRAQSQSRTSTGSGDNGSSGQVVLYGQPGNCPPTIACAPARPREPEQPRKPRLVRAKTHCDTIVVERTGEVVKRCIER